jgi:preprotein translocase subunit SecA
VEPENVTYATITLQNYFRMYKKLAGMTGTALTEAEEFDKIYKLPVLPVPTNLEYQALGSDASLVEIKAKDEDGFDYSYFARSDDPEKRIYFWRRMDYPDVIYRTAEAKLRRIVREIVFYHVQGRPMLVGTTSVEGSERLSNRLRAEPIRRLLQILLLRSIWLEKNDRFEDGRLILELQPLNTPLEQLRPEELRPIARDLGLSLNPEDPANLMRLTEILKLKEADTNRLKSVLQGGVPHHVLNARKHTEESMIIAGAGAFGAVTIATNMAGRGVDIKLGGDLAEEILSGVNRILRRAGYKDPYDMPLQERRAALQKVDPSLYGIYETEAKYFLNFFVEMERVRELGGLHIIGSERHEARRIDNQLRGRAARQGDPGSSRFYLSLEDDLMRMFGGDQVKSVMERFSIDDDYPLQARLVSNMIEQSQHRVEGSNFDIRKHTLEYDDVLNAQRQRIYSQRDRVFEKEDLVEDVNELLSQEPMKPRNTGGSWPGWNKSSRRSILQTVFSRLSLISSCWTTSTPLIRILKQLCLIWPAAPSRPIRTTSWHPPWIRLTTPAWTCRTRSTTGPIASTLPWTGWSRPPKTRGAARMPFWKNSPVWYMFLSG